MNKRLRGMLRVGVLGAAGMLLSVGNAEAQAPARTYVAAPAQGTYRMYSSGGRNYYYYTPPARAYYYAAPVQTVRRSSTAWVPYHKLKFYDWSTSRELPLAKPWMRPLP